VFSPQLEQYLGGCEAGSDRPETNGASQGEEAAAAVAIGTGVPGASMDATGAAGTKTR
jgi:hypothetical protein